MHTFDALDAASLRSDIPEFRAGERSRSTSRSSRAPAPRVQIFQESSSAATVVASARPSPSARSRSASRSSAPSAHTPIIDRIEVVTRGDVRRAKLYYLRGLRGKAAKIREKRETVPAKAEAKTD